MRRQDENDEATDSPGPTDARLAAVSPQEGQSLLRAGSLDGVDSDGFRALREAGVTTIIDLLPLYDLPDGPPRTGSAADADDFLLHHRAARVVVHCTLRRGGVCCVCSTPPASPLTSPAGRSLGGHGARRRPSTDLAPLT